MACIFEENIDVVADAVLQLEREACSATESPLNICPHFVESWQKDQPATDMYIQVVIIVWGDPRTPRLVGQVNPLAAKTNYQLRYYLDGLEKEPFLLRNAKVEFVKKGQPLVGEWVHFEVPLRADFHRLWGVVPTGYQKLGILFEARWDNKPEGSGCNAVIYYDDLFVGWGEPEG